MAWGIKQLNKQKQYTYWKKKTGMAKASYTHKSHRILVLEV